MDQGVGSPYTQGFVDPFTQEKDHFRSFAHALLATALFRCWHILIFFAGWATAICVISNNVYDLSIQSTLLTVIGTVLGFVISYRTTSSFERYNEGRKLWSQIVLGSRTFARTVWFHIPDVNPPCPTEQGMSEDERKARVIVEKKTVINLLEAFSVAVKHYLRGEDGIYYVDLYHLVKFLPGYALPASLPSMANVTRDLVQEEENDEDDDRTTIQSPRSPRSMVTITTDKHSQMGRQRRPSDALSRASRTSKVTSRGHHGPSASLSYTGHQASASHPSLLPSRRMTQSEVQLPLTGENVPPMPPMPFINSNQNSNSNRHSHPQVQPQPQPQPEHHSSEKLQLPLPVTASTPANPKKPSYLQVITSTDTIVKRGHEGGGGGDKPSSTAPSGEDDAIILFPSRMPPKYHLFDLFPFSLVVRYLTKRGKELKGKKAAKLRAKMRQNRTHNLPLEISLYLSSYIAAIQGRKVIDPPTSTLLMNTLNQLVDALTGLERILTTPIPFSYRVHLWSVTIIYNLALPFQIWQYLGWLTIPATTILSFIFFGFLVAGEEIENPFGYDKNDLNMDHFTQNIISNELRAITATPAPDPTIWAFSPANDLVFAPSHKWDEEERVTPNEWVKKGRNKMLAALVV